MDTPHFDQLTRALSARLPRRTLAGLLGLAALSGVSRAEAKHQKHHKRHNPRKRKQKRLKITTNAFGCVNVGNVCKNDSQCCSGICAGPQGKRRCHAHDASTCQAGQDVCLGVDAACTTTGGATGQCATTTGNASFCFIEGTCTDCRKDTDCETVFGPGAACIVCSDCAGQSPNTTACVGVNDI